MIMLNEQFSKQPSRKDIFQRQLHKIQEEKAMCGEKLKELDAAGKKEEMGDWTHTLMALEKEEEKLVRVLEDL